MDNGPFCLLFIDTVPNNNGPFFSKQNVKCKQALTFNVNRTLHDVVVAKCTQILMLTNLAVKRAVACRQGCRKTQGSLMTGISMVTYRYYEEGPRRMEGDALH